MKKINLLCTAVLIGLGLAGCNNMASLKHTNHQAVVPLLKLLNIRRHTEVVKRKVKRTHHQTIAQ